MTFCFLFSACNGKKDDNESDSGTGGDVTEEVMPERDIYFRAGETYALSRQLLYEGKTLSEVTISLGENSGNVQSLSFDAETFSIANGTLTIKNVTTDDYTTEKMTMSVGDEKEYINIHVVNKQKYGDTLMTVDVGRLYGKKVIFFGDSITDQSAVWWQTNTWEKIDKQGNYYKQNGRRITVQGITANYVNILDDVCKFSSYSNPAVAGALCSHYNAAYASKSISIPTQVKNNLSKISEVDYVFLMGGTNDSYEINKSGSVLRLGEISDLADETAFAASVANKPLSTFYGFYNYILKTIGETNPDAGIICLSNIPCESTYGYAGGISNGHNNEGIRGVNEAIKESSKKYLTCYVDIYSAIPFDEQHQMYVKTWFTNDLLHPNQVAYELITDKILSGK